MTRTLIQYMFCVVLLLVGACCDIGDNGYKETAACKLEQVSVIIPTCAHFTNKHVINLEDIRFGYLEHNETCTNDTRGCEEDVSKTHFQDGLAKMSGRQQSDPYLFPLSRKSVKCPEVNYSNTPDYMIAYYECVDASAMHTICSHINMTSPEIYLWNEGYPDEGELSDNEVCDCALDVTSDVIELHTYYNELNCSQNLTLTSASDDVTEDVSWGCSNNVYHHEIRSLNVSGRNMTLTWYNNLVWSNGTGKYWIKIKAINGSIHMKCPAADPVTTPPPTTYEHTTVQSNSITKGNTIHNHNKSSLSNNNLPGRPTPDSGKSKNTTESSHSGSSKKSQSKPLDIKLIIAAAAGGVGVIVVIIVIVTVVRRCNNAEEEKMIDKRMSEMRSQQSKRSDVGDSQWRDGQQHQARVNQRRKENDIEMRTRDVRQPVRSKLADQEGDVEMGVRNKAYSRDERNRTSSEQGEPRSTKQVYDKGKSGSRSNRKPSEQEPEPGSRKPRQSYDKGESGSKSNKKSSEQGEPGSKKPRQSYDKGESGSKSNKKSSEQGEPGSKKPRQSHDKGESGSKSNKKSSEQGEPGSKKTRQSYDKGESGSKSNKKSSEQGEPGSKKPRQSYDKGESGLSSNQQSSGKPEPGKGDSRSGSKIMGNPS